MLPAQGGLFAAPPALAHRLFFALRPTASDLPAIAARVEELRADGVGSRWVDPARYHLTLLYLGQSSVHREDWIRSALAAGNAIAGEPFVLQLDSLQALGNPRNPAIALVAEDMPPALRCLHVGLYEQAIRAGFQRLSSSLLPHLSLAYGTASSVLPSIAPLRLGFDRFCLLQSVEGQAEYELLAEWSFDSIE